MSMKPAVLAALAAFGLLPQDPPSDEAIRGWVEQLAALYEAERQEARKQLAGAGKAAEKRLAAGLNHGDHRVRKGCLELLALIDAPSGIERAGEIFRTKTEDRGVQAAAFEYLKRHAARSEDVFIEALDNPEESYRLGAVDALTVLKSAKALPKAAALFDKETSVPVRDRIFALLAGGGEPARPYLLKLLVSTETVVRQKALSSLLEMNTPADDLVEPVTRILKMEVTQDLLESAFAVFARAGPKAIPHLLEGLRSPSPAVRGKALDAVLKEKPESALDGVADLYHKETDENIRRKAEEYLIGQGLRAEPAFIKALESSIPQVRIDAIPALGKIKSEKVFDRVAALYRNDKDPRVREKCFEYLESVGLRAEDELIGALKDENAALRIRAIRALGRAQSQKAIAPLAELLKEDKPIRPEAVEALAQIGEKAVAHLQEGVKARSVRESDAAEVFVLFNQAAVEKALDAFISEDGSTGTWTGMFEGLAKLPRDRVMPVLWKMVTDTGYAVRFRDPQKTPPGYTTYLQCLAILAIGDLGDADALKRLQGLAFPAGEDRHREQLVALHRLGDKEPLTAFVAGELKAGRGLLPGENRRDAYPKLFTAAQLLARVGRKDEALKIYVELAGVIDQARNAADYDDTDDVHYNIACIHASAGRKAEALSALTRAVELGFREVDWMSKDRELDPIRGEEGFKKLVAEAEKNRKK